MGKQLIDGAARLNGFWVMPHEVRIIGLDTKDGPAHPLYDPRIHLPLDEGLVLSIMARGVLKPILIRKNGEFVDVLAGRQRTRACREANRRIAEVHGIDPEDPKEALLKKLPLLPKHSDGKDALGLGAAENIHVVSDAMTNAKSVQRMLDNGFTAEQIAVDIGKTPAVVYQLIKLLSLGEKMQAAVERGVLAPSAAALYADATIEKQEEIIADAESRGIIISVPEAKRQREERKKTKTNGHTNGDGDVTRGSPISRSVIRKLLESDVFKSEVDEASVRTVLAWVIGEPNMDRKIKGLRKALVDVGAIKPESES